MTLELREHGPWYDLFARADRDWLRHDRRLRQAALQTLEGRLVEASVLSVTSQRPLHLDPALVDLHRFRLLESGDRKDGSPSGRTGPGQPGQSAEAPPPPGQEAGQALPGLELDWEETLEGLWQALELPDLSGGGGEAGGQDWRPEGWGRRGSPARLDRRRTVRASVRRQAMGEAGPLLHQEDLRYRQHHPRPRTRRPALVVLVLDVSSSLDVELRTLAKSCFFWLLTGLRRCHPQLEPVLIAHAGEAWLFDEADFFRLEGRGGTRLSPALERVAVTVAQRDPAGEREAYLFYASDGECDPGDREAARRGLEELACRCRLLGYLEVTRRPHSALITETGRLFQGLEEGGARARSAAVGSREAIAGAVARLLETL